MYSTDLTFYDNFCIKPILGKYTNQSKKCIGTDL